jgi:hypothetical protein
MRMRGSSTRAIESVLRGWRTEELDCNHNNGRRGREKRALLDHGECTWTEWALLWRSTYPMHGGVRAALLHRANHAVVLAIPTTACW